MQSELKSFLNEKQKEEQIQSFFTKIQANKGAMDFFITELQTKDVLQVPGKKVSKMEFHDTFVAEDNKKYLQKEKNRYDSFIVYNHKDKTTFKDKIATHYVEYKKEQDEIDRQEALDPRNAKLVKIRENISFFKKNKTPSKPLPKVKNRLTVKQFRTLQKNKAGFMTEEKKPAKFLDANLSPEFNNLNNPMFDSAEKESKPDKSRSKSVNPNFKRLPQIKLKENKEKRLPNVELIERRRKILDVQLKEKNMKDRWKVPTNAQKSLRTVKAKLQIASVFKTKINLPKLESQDTRQTTLVPRQTNLNSTLDQTLAPDLKLVKQKSQATRASRGRVPTESSIDRKSTQGRARFIRKDPTKKLSGSSISVYTGSVRGTTKGETRSTARRNAKSSIKGDETNKDLLLTQGTINLNGTIDETMCEDGVVRKRKVKKRKKSKMQRRKLDRVDDHLLKDHFKVLCQEPLDANIRTCRVNRGKMRAFLAQKYKGRTAEKLLTLFNFSIPVDFDGFCGMMEGMMNEQRDSLNKLSFLLYDFEGDKKIGEYDLFQFMKHYADDDDIFVEAFLDDILKVIKAIYKKKREKGKHDEIAIRMQEIEQMLKDVKNSVKFEDKKKMKIMEQLFRKPSSDFSGESSSDSDQDNLEITKLTATSGADTKRNSRAQDVQKSRRMSILSKRAQSITRQGTMKTNRSNKSRRASMVRQQTNKSIKAPSLKSRAQSRRSSKTKLASSRRGSVSQKSSKSSRSRTKSRMMLTRSATRMNVGRSEGMWLLSSRSGTLANDPIKKNNDNDIEENLQEEVMAYLQKKITGDKRFNEYLHYDEFSKIEFDNGFTQFSKHLIEYLCLQKVDLPQGPDKKRMFRIQDMLREMKGLYDDDHYEQLLDQFKILTKNPQELVLEKMFLTEDSINAKFHNILGFNSEFLSRIFYQQFAQGVDKARIDFGSFLKILYPIYYGNKMDQQYFIYQLFDVDRDNKLDVLDLLQLQYNLPENSKLGREIKLITSWYIEKEILKKDKALSALDFNSFLIIIQKESCLIKEVQRMFLGDMIPMSESVFTEEFESHIKKKEKNKIRRKREKMLNVQSLVEDKKKVGFQI